MAGSAKKKRGLGRGLGSLISSKPVPVSPEARAAETQPASSGKASGDKVVNLPVSDTADLADTSGLVKFVPLSTVVPNPDQPRKFFEESEVEELVSSIKNHGVLQPILVRPSGDSKELQIVAGERRFRAATRAKLAQIPVIIRDIDDRDCLEISLVENVQRSNLTPMEEANGYQELISRFQLTQGEVAEKVGKDRATVSNMVRLLKLPAEVQKQIDGGDISVGHAKAILTVKEPKLQVALASKVVTEGMSVRELERIVSRKVSLKNKRNGATGAAGKTKAKYRDITEELQKALGTKIKIQESAKGKGKILVDFHSMDELERIADQICFRD